MNASAYVLGRGFSAGTTLKACPFQTNQERRRWHDDELGPPLHGLRKAHSKGAGTRGTLPSWMNQNRTDHNPSQPDNLTCHQHSNSIGSGNAEQVETVAEDLRRQCAETYAAFSHAGFGLEERHILVKG